MIFWKILLAHVLTDFIFQPDQLAENKEKVTVLLVCALWQDGIYRIYLCS